MLPRKAYERGSEMVRTAGRGYSRLGVHRSREPSCGHCCENCWGVKTCHLQPPISIFYTFQFTHNCAYCRDQCRVFLHAHVCHDTSGIMISSITINMSSQHIRAVVQPVWPCPSWNKHPKIFCWIWTKVSWPLFNSENSNFPGIAVGKSAYK